MTRLTDTEEQLQIRVDMLEKILSSIAITQTNILDILTKLIK